jgi:hypothetical protein
VHNVRSVTLFLQPFLYKTRNLSIIFRYQDSHDGSSRLPRSRVDISNQCARLSSEFTMRRNSAVSGGGVERFAGGLYENSGFDAGIFATVY